MAFLRRWLLVGCALVLGGGSLLAAASREDRTYAVAVAAFQDGVWNRAETGFAQFVQKYPKSTNAPMALLLEAQAELKQGKLADATGLLTVRRGAAGSLADQYEYWMAQAQSQSGDFAAAADTLNSLVQNFPGSPLRLRAVVEAAAAYLQLNDWTHLDALLAAPGSFFQHMAQADDGNELVVRGRLLLAQAEFARKQFPAARAVLNLLNPATLTPELDNQRLFLLAQVQFGAGDTDAALAAATNLTQRASGQKGVDFAAAGAALRGLILEQSGRLPEAIAAWSENLTNNIPAERQREAVLKIAALAAAEKNLPVAEDALNRFLTQFGVGDPAVLARLRLGELYLQECVAQPAADRLALAQDQFAQVIGAATNGPLAGKAQLDRGWCFWLITNYSASFTAFKLATEQLPVSEDLAVAKFKAGDALFVQTNFAGAREYYQAVLTQFAALPAVADALGDRALYQVLRADLELKNAAGAEDEMRRLLQQFPNSELVDKSLLLTGEGFSDFSSPTNARAVFDEFEKEYPDSPLRPQVALAVARTYEREPDWPTAIAVYEQWRGDFATNRLRPQVEFSLAQANFHAGNEALAFDQFTNFVAQYPADPLAPAAQWWVAEHFFRAGDFVNAEKNYQLLYQSWPADMLVYPARLMAGRAAIGRQGFPDAAHYFTLLTGDTNCPASIWTQAMFAYGSVLTRLDSPDTNRPFLNIEAATNVFAQLAAQNPTNETGALAWSEIGDCDLQLGALVAATNAYAQVISSPFAGAGVRSRAQVGQGQVLEKMAAASSPDERPPLLAQALKNYLDVFYSTDPVADFWIKKAGLAALPLLNSAGAAEPKQVNKFLDRLEEKLPQLRTALELKRAALKN
jgi:TolA-binding protein